MISWLFCFLVFYVNDSLVKFSDRCDHCWYVAVALHSLEAGFGVQQHRREPTLRHIFLHGFSSIHRTVVFQARHSRSQLPSSLNSELPIRLIPLWELKVLITSTFKQPIANILLELLPKALLYGRNAFERDDSHRPTVK